ncbi:unnamed protein product [Nezara viridula]|uniref:Uncharacterized protein n=1 Tax=Nezara viridula TaxID=85310 RepID=A0A9P0H8V2_NEZVI|nr:unnamed protein product [Nezara viridula]
MTGSQELGMRILLPKDCSAYLSDRAQRPSERSPTANIHRYQWSGPTARCVPWPPQCALARWRSPVQPLSHSVQPKGAEHP